MYLFNEHLNNAFSQYSGSNPLDWLHNFSRHHRVKEPTSGLLFSSKRDEAGYKLSDYLTHDQLFNGSTVTRAIAEYWADSPDETERLVESTIRGGGFGDDLEEMNVNSMGIRQEQKNQSYLFKRHKSLRIGFFLHALGYSSDYVEQLKELLNQLRLKARDNKRAENDEEHELLNQIRETDKKLGVLSEFERHSSTENIARKIATSYHEPAEATPKGESLPFNYADDGERELHRIINICSKPASIIDNIKKLCKQSGSGWLQVNNDVARFKFQRNDGFDDGQLQITLNSDAVRKQRDRLCERLGITKSDKLADKSDKSDV